MAKRLTDSEIWKTQRWFRKLKPEYKLAFLYIKDQCDHSGVWNTSILDLMDDTGIDDFDINDFIIQCNKDYEPLTGVQKGRERLRTLPNGSVWLTGFCQFQYAGKDKKIAIGSASKSALTMLSGHNLLEYAVENQYITLLNPSEPPERGKDKNKDKDINTLHNLNHNKVKQNGEKLFSENGQQRPPYGKW